MRTALLLALAAFSGCASEVEASRELYELERLAFVPAARFKLVQSNDPNADCSMKTSIVIDRFEFTHRDQLFYQEQMGTDVSLEKEEEASDLVVFADDRLDRPAPMDFYTAEALAQARGMRIPRAKEWIHVAVGRKQLRYPWGSRRGRFANTEEIELGRPVRVGTFENGRVEPFGCYDMLGNVWEWVADEAPSFFPQFEPIEGEVTSVMGGGFDSPLDYLYSNVHQRLCFYARTLRKDAAGPSYGVRMCADAADYLRSKATTWGEGPEAQARVGEVGRRWAEDFVAREALKEILAKLLEEPDAPVGLQWLQAGLESAQDS